MLVKYAASDDFETNHRHLLPDGSNINASRTPSSIDKINFPLLSSPLIHPSMASLYSCANCGADLNLSSANQFPEATYFEAGNKGTISFSWVDESKLNFTKEDKIRPFFETVNYWGIQRKRTRMQCDACGFLVGYVYDDGLPMMEGTGQFGMGPSQAIPRRPRYRFKTKALTIT